jgi:hypothetical protein
MGTAQPQRASIAATEERAMTEMISVGRRPARAWKIGLGVLLLLMAAGNSTRPAAEDSAGALGALTAILILVFGGAALIASGLPKNIGNPEFTKARRRLWYKLMGVGLLVMVGSAVSLFGLGFPAAAVLVTWLYWFVWTWVSWKYADRKTLERISIRA